MIAILTLITCAAGVTLPPSQVEHIEVYYEEDRFGGWPANHGIWIWGDEILTGYSRGWYKDLGDRHHIDREKPEEHWLARSRDGGQTWILDHPTVRGYLIPRGAALHGIEDPNVSIPPLKECPGGIDFHDPDFAFTMRMDNIDGGVSRFEYSYDRGRSWEGPFALPNFGTPGLAARTDYIIDGKHEMTVFLTAAKSNRQEGRPFCARTTDGGGTWEFVGWIGPEPEGFSIMPASVRLSEDELLVAVRRREGPQRFIESWRSMDNGKTWENNGIPVPSTGIGNPPAMIKLRDGRICLTYGVRAEPWRICARLSDDGGRTWSEEIILRDDGTSQDIGYVRTVQRPDGKIVTVYYFTDAAHDPERYIAATIWETPASAETGPVGDTVTSP